MTRLTAPSSWQRTKRQRDEAAASGVRNMQQPTAEAFFELFRKAADGLTPATTAVVDMHRADVPEAIPLVQLIPFKPQIGKDGEPLTQPVASVAHDDATQKFLRQNWDLQRQFSTNGALRDAELAMLSPPLLLRGTPADAKKRIEGLRDRLKTYCVELKEVMKAKPVKAKATRPPVNAAVDPLWLKEHIDVDVTMMERLVGTPFPRTVMDGALTFGRRSRSSLKWLTKPSCTLKGTSRWWLSIACNSRSSATILKRW